MAVSILSARMGDCRLARLALGHRELADRPGLTEIMPGRPGFGNARCDLGGCLESNFQAGWPWQFHKGVVPTPQTSRKIPDAVLRQRNQDGDWAFKSANVMFVACVA